jgi:hypothetical protein
MAAKRGGDRAADLTMVLGSRESPCAAEFERPLSATSRYVGSWPIASPMKVGFGATQARRLLAAVEINDRIGADRPVSVTRCTRKQTVVAGRAGKKALTPDKL